jgi:hypothetical protein
MRYTVEFDLRPDVGNPVSETVYKALVSAFGSVENFRVTSGGATFIGNIRGDQPIIWYEVPRK